MRASYKDLRRVIARTAVFEVKVDSLIVALLLPVRYKTPPCARHATECARPRRGLRGRAARVEATRAK